MQNLWTHLWDYLPTLPPDGTELEQDLQFRTELQDPEQDPGQDPGTEPQDQDAELGDEDESPTPDEDGEDEAGSEEDEPETDLPFTPAGPKPIPGFWTNGINYTRDFDSWHEFVTSAANRTLYAWGNPGIHSHDASHIKDNKDWSGTNTFDEAVEMALYRGWPEGRNLLSESLAMVAPRPKVYSNLEFEVAGAFPCVPMYCASDPGCMVMDGSTQRNAKPIIRIDYNNWIISSVQTKDMMLRGAAVISLANTLEQRGFSTELRIIGNSEGWDGKIFRYNIVYKRAGELLDLDRAAFALAHPASMRRLAFAIMEQHTDLVPGFKSGYGRPMHEANDPTSGLPGGAIFVPGSHGNETPETARKAVEDAAIQLLQTLNTVQEAA